MAARLALLLLGLARGQMLLMLDAGWGWCLRHRGLLLRRGLPLGTLLLGLVEALLLMVVGTGWA